MNANKRPHPLCELLLNLFLVCVVICGELVNNANGEEATTEHRMVPSSDIEPDDMLTEQRCQFLAFFRHDLTQNGTLLFFNDTTELMKDIPDTPKVTVIVHGFKTNTLRTFLKVKDALLNNAPEDMRPDVVIVVDWRTNSNLKRNLYFGYKDAALNTDSVGREIAYLLYNFKRHRNMQPSDVHLIGFSLGAQAIGITARKVVLSYNFGSKVGRLTGLDPAAPRFEDFKAYMNKDDGKFVDIIHTNGGSLIRGA